AGLLPCHRHFYRKASLLSEPFTPAWLLAIGLVALSAGWLGFFAYRHVEYSNALWWQFSFGGEGEAPRFLRALVGSGALVLFFALAKLLRPARPRPARPSAAELERAAAIVAAYPRAQAHLALLGDKDLLFSENDDGLLMYGIEGRSWVAMGDPVASAPELRRELAWRFRELCEEYDGWPVFYQVRHDQLDLYLELGLTLLKIGEEARVDLPAFTLEGKAKGQLRTALRKLEREGCRFEVVPATAVPILLPQLRQVSDAWLAAKSVREKGFSLGRFDPAYLARGPLALVWREERIIAFANLWCGGGEELAIDLMRHLPGTPNGTMDYLFTQAILWGKVQGYAWFNLGMAPLAGLHSRSLAPLWNRFGSLVFGRGERFYNFRGVRQYKDKFGPIWEPRYLAVPGGIALPRILVNLTSLIAGGLQGVVPR
ncbi:MAG TPA: phosphatidylglycerol lysyltransferase domain-containing protein, partial [Candidatus Competibacteraceae bacterium]|nr:phosphatidylglycerol lysyltransferase domain-containing protein [Candidatus Competibacteraceae bacterium]